MAMAAISPTGVAVDKYTYCEIVNMLMAKNKDYMASTASLKVKRMRW